MNRSTIAAIATPYGSGGIGIIRISGDGSTKIAETLFRRSGHPVNQKDASAYSRLKSHRFYHGHIIEPTTQKIIDEVLVVVMRAPKSYTREDVVEIQSHSGYIVLGQIFENILNAGARIAEPGEFTRRAFLNGRIDLTQAEAVADIINAKTSTALRIAARQIEGRLKTRIENVRQALKAIRTDVEAVIDFPDDIGEIFKNNPLIPRLQEDVIPVLEALLHRYRKGRHFRKGVKMAVVGRPNVGKSSLLNCLIERDRAIVTPMPGTTRDVIEESLNVDGLPVVIMDTAGLQDTEEEVERRGIEKTIESIETADIILFLIDLSEDLFEEDRRIFEKVRQKPHIVVQNKIDIVDRGSRGYLPREWEKSPMIKISAREGTHIGKLKQLIKETVVGEKGVIEEIGVVPNARHKAAIEGGLRSVKRAVKELENGTPIEIAAIDIKDAVDKLGEVIGHQCGEDILDQIFSRFCIGK
jgi:tRNA modification GTPase